MEGDIWADVRLLERKSTPVRVYPADLAGAAAIGMKLRDGLRNANLVKVVAVHRDSAPPLDTSSARYGSFCLAAIFFNLRLICR